MSLLVMGAQFYVGIDRAAVSHAVCVLDDTGRRVAAFSIEHSAYGFTTLVRRLGRLSTVDRIAVAIERPDGRLVADAQRELILTTYSAKPYAALLSGLQAAIGRGVHVWIIVETLQGAGGALQGDQPAIAFAGLTGAEMWTWALGQRPEGAKMHAKLAVADERTLFISSANLTTSDIDTNMEAGVLVRGGTAARRAAEHLRALRRDKILIRI